jgi:formylglycine-generating enzyme required for sulfatase activity
VTALHLRDVLGERRFEAAEFPLSIGGQGCAIVLAGAQVGALAYLGLQDQQLFLQSAEGATVLRNGAAITGSTWIRADDVIDLAGARLKLIDDDGRRVLEVTDTAQANITAPPVIATIAAADAADEEPLAAIRFRAQQNQTAARSSFPVARIVTAAFVVLLLATAWFVFTATSLVVVTEPQQAEVSIDGPWPRLAVGAQFLLRPGEYRVSAVAPGHAALQRTVRVTNAANQRVTLALPKLPGRLRIETPEPVQVALNGKQAGSSPGPFELAAGKHRIELSSPRYQPFSTQLNIEGAGREQRLAPELVPNWAEVSIASEPSGARVLIDGEERGVTPANLQLLAGTHAIELQREGFKAWTNDVQVKANQPLQLGPIRLGLPDARVAIRSEPAGASVAVGGVYRGVTPLEVELRPEVEHSIVLTRPGYTTASRTLTLQPGQHSTLSVPMSGVFGEVTVRAQPADAELYVNGERRGNANQTLKLVTSAQQIEVRKAGYAPFTATVTPREGLPQVVEAKLVTQSQARMAAIPASLRTKSGIELKLMPLGRYTMGSPRREPGRRANEAQRPVELRRPFYMALHEVTNEQMRAFRSSHKAGFVGQHSLDLDRQPAVNIGWIDAAQFCNWLSQQEGLPPAYVEKDGTLVAASPMTTGYRLPTEAEWEWAARYESANELRRYPWGDALPVPANAGNFADQNARLLVQHVLPGYDDGYAATAPVGKFAANALGLFDLGGNVAEWAHDFYVISVPGAEVSVDPMGPATGQPHVIRGSSWRHSSATDLRLSARDFGQAGRPDLGFRVARYAEEVKP